MSNRTITFPIVTLLTLGLTVPTYAAGGGAAGTGGTGAASGATGGTEQTSGNPAAKQQAIQQKKEIEAKEKKDATTGSNTQPSNSSDGAVSAPGVGVGHSANGLPIGSPGSGLGSPENSDGSTTR
jgi:hypothetical protein